MCPCDRRRNQRSRGSSAAPVIRNAIAAEITTAGRGGSDATTATAGTSAANRITKPQTVRIAGRSSTCARYERSKHE